MVSSDSNDAAYEHLYSQGYEYDQEEVTYCLVGELHKHPGSDICPQDNP